MGYVAENSLIQSSLLQTLERVDAFFPSVVSSLEYSGNDATGHDPATLVLEDGSTLRTQLVRVNDLYKGGVDV